MAIKINPNAATLYPVNMDDYIESGLHLSLDPNAINLTVNTGRMRINGMFMDLETPIVTNLSACGLGRWLMCLSETRDLIFMNDNLNQLKLVVGIIDKSLTQTLVTPVLYSSVGLPQDSVPMDVFSPQVNVETQIRMLFDELAQNKIRDAQLKYEETLETLPVDYNAVAIENFDNTAYVLSSELVVNPYTKTASLGLVAPYPTAPKKLIEQVTLPNAISKCYFMIDRQLNQQSCSVRISLNGGATWVDYTNDGEYSAGTGNVFKIEITAQTSSENTSPVIRSWAVFYHSQA